MKTMFMSFIVSISLCNVCLADEPLVDYEKAASQMRTVLLSALRLSPHFSGIDITGCDSVTGGHSPAEGSEPCVRIFFRSYEAVTAARMIYPEGRRTNDTYIIVEYMSPILR